MSIQVLVVNIIIMNERCRFRAVSPVLCYSSTFRLSCSLHFLLWRPAFLFIRVWFCSASLVKPLFPFYLHAEANLSDLVYYIFLINLLNA